jgi:hypothetical protein
MVISHMRRLLNQAANAAVMSKGSLFEIVYRRSVPRLGHNQAIGAIAHRQSCTRESVTKNAARLSTKGRSKSAPPE